MSRRSRNSGEDGADISGFSEMDKLKFVAGADREKYNKPPVRREGWEVKFLGAGAHFATRTWSDSVNDMLA